MDTTTHTHWYEDVVLPALLRHARTAYGLHMRDALAKAGYDDLPRNGMYVIGGLALGHGDVPLSELIRQMRISKQAAGQLVDTLVLRGYLEREVDSTDRRRLNVRLTARGQAAAEAQQGARRQVDELLQQAVGEEAVQTTRRTLAALYDIGRQFEDSNAED
ncbi:helix-turn-helix domain-containing protein [Oleiagrimonas sp. C23AA]|uniref:MarR family winged helix-turn-helix transcriptional regulator n=1 Tax=Oleiagrimonas sp. C23AA TaxID=2719047 RepID=UPI001420F627|nr:helix-turn-helix domain-containing protein [Oleiagrimonas sp. C23AA]NII10407.1 MarR family transcriptional regulator [Oleiagrimonas sp. C23AA]